VAAIFPGVQRKQRGEREKSLLTEMNPFADDCPGGFRRQHPYRNLQPLAGTVDD
jgi:hypothetical protein